MVLKEWDSLPTNMRNESVKKYYDLLKKKRIQLVLKRYFDVIAASLALIILFPMLLLIAVLIKIDSKGPVLFRQTRVTQYGKLFRIFKFRTMTVGSDQNGLQVTLKDDRRITEIGKSLRKYRFDEIPQLLNIIEGSMTFVGSRPEVVPYVEQYSQEMLATLLLPAGVTSEASIRFKEESNYLVNVKDPEITYIKVVLPLKMKINLEAMERFSFLGDIKTLLRTFAIIFKRKSSASGEDTPVAKTNENIEQGLCTGNKVKENQRRVNSDREVKEKKLVALITNNDDDVYCFRKELIERLLTEGYTVLISCPYGEKLELMKEIPYLYDDVSIDRRGTSIFKDFRLFLHYFKLLRNYRPEVVLTYTVKPNVYGSIAAGILKIPYINNVTGLGSILKKNLLLRKFILLLYRLAFRKSQRVFFQNSENLELAKKQRLMKGRFQLIPGSGVNSERFHYQTYPLETNGIVFNYIGRILKEKGIDDYLEAAGRIKQNHNNTEFNILGFIEPTEKHYKTKIEQLENLGIVKYRGNQNDVRPWIGRAHAIIHPSNYGEGMSNVLLENASSGRPAITTNIAGCREIIRPGVTGFLYQAGNVDELVLQIENFLNLSHVTREQMGVAAREKVVNEFSRDYVIAAYIGEVNKICQNI